MKTYFVSRHPGAHDWATRNGFAAVEAVSHFDPAIVQAGDIVIGTLPVNLIAAVCERGGEYRHLTLDLTPETRGKELTANDMDRLGVRLERFQVFTEDAFATRVAEIVRHAEGWR